MVSASKHNKQSVKLKQRWCNSSHPHKYSIRILVVFILCKSQSPIAAAEDRKGKGPIRIRGWVPNNKIKKNKHYEKLKQQIKKEKETLMHP
jgi:hypothetical protein